ncbi:MAG: hypothetical protein LC799_25365 [Actinobacteria bacterium]|nr:hypothetical protein [Actinomycetota bacterium]
MSASGLFDRELRGSLLSRSSPPPATYLDAARTVQSRRITSELTSLRNATAKYRKLTDVAGLRHRLNHALAAV